MATVHLEIDPSLEARLSQTAAASGMTVEQYIHHVVREAADHAPPIDSTLALFATWETEDETSDPEELAARTRDCEALEAALRANRFSLP